MGTDLIRLDSDGAKLLARVFGETETSFDELLPATMTPPEVIRSSKTMASVYDQIDGLKAITIQALGRLHWLARQDARVIEIAGCANLHEYEDRVLKCRDQRATVWKFSRAYDTFPDLTPGRAAKIGTVNLDLASRIAKDALPSTKEDILEHATEPTAKFRTWIENGSGRSAPGETTGAMFELFGSSAEIRTLKEWFADEALVRWAGGQGRPIDIVLKTIAETTTDENYIAETENGDTPPFSVTTKEEEARVLGTDPKVLW